MFSARWLFAPVLVGVFAVASVQAGEKQPAKASPIVVRVSSIDAVVNSTKRMMIAILGPGKAQEVEQQLAAQFPNGLQGIDTKKPIGLYGNLDADLKKS